MILPRLLAMTDQIIALQNHLFGSLNYCQIPFIPSTCCSSGFIDLNGEKKSMSKWSRESVSLWMTYSIVAVVRRALLQVAMHIKQIFIE